MWVLTAETIFDHVADFVDCLSTGSLSSVNGWHFFLYTCLLVGPFLVHHHHFLVVMWLVCLMLRPLFFFGVILKKRNEDFSSRPRFT